LKQRPRKRRLLKKLPRPGRRQTRATRHGCSSRPSWSC
jgi:hypothetical protein